MTYDVVVCGAGVAGLAAACALGRLGRRVLLVDKQERVRPVAKGEVFQPGALAILHEWGVATRLEAAGALRLGMLVARDAEGRAQMALDYARLPAQRNWLLAQDYPAILEALTKSLPDNVEFSRGKLITGLLSSGGRITGVRIGDDVVEAALVVAADGMSSRLRREAGIEIRRDDYPHRLVALELHDAPEVEPDFSAYVTPRGLRLRYPLPDGRIRLYAQTGTHEMRGLSADGLDRWATDLVRETPALAPLEESIRTNLAARQLLPVSRFLAPSLAVPGLALVGDSGHTVHPMAAQGMNSAIADAHELATMLRQGGSLAPSAVDHALTRYSAARRENLAHIGRTSHNAARMITDLSWVGRFAGRRALRGTGGNDRIRYTVMHTMSGLGVHPLTPLDRLHQLGLLPDPRARQLPSWA
ncbi:FAD-dependent oxidoreductase [Saccharopolyspora spinosa]|uniref:2-polyprenyl-6-methoxyphenol hydroxylase-like FAD-dependent oxidoreductase n=1 Tax=Saccharopolyspora spinosa TaxID=60894 RepID=A0A2N3Y4W2_SACSN|nr:NAD(P)/FAD-dependent oxidoreductase [Saccharopolyspora spinosa]PKW17966.1 2-polyprenyl-6-methoxyphenol hydroxylase-like FAD-dependent oxidoreductase [Saccharopolyspora spinosa]